MNSQNQPSPSTDNPPTPAEGDTYVTVDTMEVTGTVERTDILGEVQTDTLLQINSVLGDQVFFTVIGAQAMTVQGEPGDATVQALEGELHAPLEQFLDVTI